MEEKKQVHEVDAVMGCQPSRRTSTCGRAAWLESVSIALEEFLELTREVTVTLIVVNYFHGNFPLKY